MTEETKSKKILLAIDDERTLREWLAGLKSIGFTYDDETDELIERAKSGHAGVSHGDHQVHFTSSGEIAEQAVSDRSYDGLFVDGIVGGHSTHIAINNFLGQSEFNCAHIMRNSTAVLINYAREKWPFADLLAKELLKACHPDFGPNEAHIKAIFGIEDKKVSRSLVPVKMALRQARLP